MCGLLMRRDGEQPGMIVVSGETGVGKTRLLDEFAIQASAQGAVTLCGGRGAHADQFGCGAFVALEEYAANRQRPSARSSRAHTRPWHGSCLRWRPGRSRLQRPIYAITTISISSLPSSSS
jgi:hypothetical protein